MNKIHTLTHRYTLIYTRFENPLPLEQLLSKKYFNLESQSFVTFNGTENTCLSFVVQNIRPLALNVFIEHLHLDVNDFRSRK